MSPSPYSFPTKYRSVESFSPTPEVWENADARERMRIVIDGVADATAFLMTRFTNGIPIISTQSEPYGIAPSDWIRQASKVLRSGNALEQDEGSAKPKLTRGLILPHDKRRFFWESNNICSNTKASDMQGPWILREPTIYGVHPSEDPRITIEDIRAEFVKAMEASGVDVTRVTPILDSYAALHTHPPQDKNGRPRRGFQQSAFPDWRSR